MIRFLHKIRADFPFDCLLIRLFGAGRRNMPIERINYCHNKKYCIFIARINKGGTCRVISMYYNKYFDRGNLPFAILMSDII